jgi:hypothetical protein
MSSHGHDAEVLDLLGFHAMLFGKRFLTFWRIVVPSYLFNGQIVQGDFFGFYYLHDEDTTNGA